MTDKKFRPDALLAVPITQVTSQIWLGNMFDALDYDDLRERGITAVANLTQDEYFHEDNGFICLRLDQEDRCPIPKEKLERFLKWMDERIDAGDKVLIHCHYGISRTPAFLIAWLLHRQKVSNDMDLRTLWSEHEDAIQVLRYLIDPHYLLKLSILQHFGYEYQTLLGPKKD